MGLADGGDGLGADEVLVQVAAADAAPVGSDLHGARPDRRLVDVVDTNITVAVKADGAHGGLPCLVVAAASVVGFVKRTRVCIPHTRSRLDSRTGGT
jgi:hypothetical protein